jgi:hypothetical protein
MTDSTNSMSLRGFPPWRVITHREMIAMSTNLSRRAIVAGVAAVPALAVPALAAMEPVNALAQLADRDMRASLWNT